MSVGKVNSQAQVTPRLNDIINDPNNDSIHIEDSKDKHGFYTHKASPRHNLYTAIYQQQKDTAKQSTNSNNIKNTDAESLVHMVNMYAKK
jgi:hypothetical protein